eukprot:CAMPEP_0178423340 /NCGR_PEP_ID=MMETSP0689_2-20121128/27636_1 /TAXON_ID=160604 /ORGANISM="Amphidinium massartii, Strain CS-259" /LENGTH=195 /DNA_ID=CAMNT_0020044927 /DNA_START=18 /DNA_END=602 /DNA_ORIENTATION=-
MELLVRAVQAGNYDEAAKLLKIGRLKGEVAQPCTGSSPLHIACRSGHQDIVRLLVQNGASVNVTEIASIGGRAPLHLAACQGLTPIAATLLEGRADVNIADAKGLTPLHVAAQDGHLEVTRILLRNGADPHIRDGSGFNAAYWAKEFGFRSVVDVYASMQVFPQKLLPSEALKQAKEAGAMNKVGAKKKKAARSK